MNGFKYNGRNGFTLIEVLVASILFSMLGMGVMIISRNLHTSMSVLQLDTMLEGRVRNVLAVLHQEFAECSRQQFVLGENDDINVFTAHGESQSEITDGSTFWKAAVWGCGYKDEDEPANYNAASRIDYRVLLELETSDPLDQKGKYGAYDLDGAKQHMWHYRILVPYETELADRELTRYTIDDSNVTYANTDGDPWDEITGATAPVGMGDGYEDGSAYVYTAFVDNARNIDRDNNGTFFDEWPYIATAIPVMDETNVMGFRITLNAGIPGRVEASANQIAIYLRLRRDPVDTPLGYVMKEGMVVVTFQNRIRDTINPQPRF